MVRMCWDASGVCVYICIVGLLLDVFALLGCVVLFGMFGFVFDVLFVRIGWDCCCFVV